MGKQRTESCGNQGEVFIGRADCKCEGPGSEGASGPSCEWAWIVGRKTERIVRFYPYTLTTTVGSSVLSLSLGGFEVRTGSVLDADGSTSGPKKPEWEEYHEPSGI